MISSRMTAKQINMSSIGCSESDEDGEEDEDPIRLRGTVSRRSDRRDEIP
jgi:hypothetical protein